MRLSDNSNGADRYRARIELLEAARAVLESRAGSSRTCEDHFLVGADATLRLEKAVEKVESLERKNRTSWGNVLRPACLVPILVLAVLSSATAGEVSGFDLTSSTATSLLQVRGEAISRDNAVEVLRGEAAIPIEVRIPFRVSFEFSIDPLLGGGRGIAFLSQSDGSRYEAEITPRGVDLFRVYRGNRVRILSESWRDWRTSGGRAVATLQIEDDSILFSECEVGSFSPILVESEEIPGWSSGSVSIFARRAPGSVPRFYWVDLEERSPRPTPARDLGPPPGYQTLESASVPSSAFWFRVYEVERDSRGNLLLAERWTNRLYSPGGLERK